MMGGTCTTTKTSENSGKNGEQVPNANVASSDWDETESDVTTYLTDDSVDVSNQDDFEIDDTTGEFAPGNEGAHTPNEEVTEVKKEEKHKGGENPVNDEEALEDPIKAIYSETEFLSKKRQAFTLDMDLYKELTR